MKNTKMSKGSPTFNYFSKCCEVRAEKEPCAKKPEDKKTGKWSESTLGHWRCTNCGKPCKVNRTKREEVKRA